MLCTHRVFVVGGSGALSGKSKHIPYRNSKLTYLLADSLGGKNPTVLPRLLLAACGWQIEINLPTSMTDCARECGLSR